MRVLDLFSGIGGFSLGLERAGMRTVAFCEIDPYCRRVLAKHWPDVPCFEDIRGIDGFELGRIGGIEVVCGGFPCQDISVAGNGLGLAGARSSLWSELCRVIGLARPQYAIVENVSALLGRGLGDVLRDLAAIGYDAEWHCIPAAAIGAPHRRDRIWIVAHARERGLRGIFQSLSECGSEAAPDIGGDGKARALANAHREGQPQPQRFVRSKRRRARDGGTHLAHSTGAGSQISGHLKGAAGRWRDSGQLDYASWWAVEPDVGRMAHGIPSRVDRLKCLGNAVVPQVVEMIGRAILSGGPQ